MVLTRKGSYDDAISLIIPSSFVRFAPPPPPLLPPPGQVTLKDLAEQDGTARKASDALRFLVPWANEKATLEETMAAQRRGPNKSKPPSHPSSSDNDEDDEIRRDEDIAKCQVCIDTRAYAKYSTEYGIEEAVRAVFCAEDDPIDEILKSLVAPFTDENGSSIAWTIVRRVRVVGSGTGSGWSAFLSNRVYGQTGVAWSVVTLVDEVVEKEASKKGDKGERGSRRQVPRQNLIYDGHGRVRACCDFGHQSNPTVHIHPLVPGSLEHSAPESTIHCLPYEACPWFWSCVHGGEQGVEDVTWMPRTGEVEAGEFEWVRISVAYDPILCDDGLGE